MITFVVICDVVMYAVVILIPVETTFVVTCDEVIGGKAVVITPVDTIPDVNSPVVTIADVIELVVSGCVVIDSLVKLSLVICALVKLSVVTKLVVETSELFIRQSSSSETSRNYENLVIFSNNPNSKLYFHSLKEFRTQIEYFHWQNH